MGDRESQLHHSDGHQAGEEFQFQPEMSKPFFEGKAEVIIFKGIKFRRYPDSKHRTYRVYYTPNGSHRANGVKHLHQEIWESVYGPLPKGFAVHHIDHNPLNNSIQNLQAIPFREHMSHHMSTDEQRARSRKTMLEKAMPAARAWHSTDEGRKFHSENGKLVWDIATQIEKNCVVCAGKYSVVSLCAYKSKFCSNKCKSQYRRDMGLDNIEKTCVVCGKTFVQNKYRKSKSCSGRCAFKSRGHKTQAGPGL